jgi:hypothetical protein
MNHERKGYDEDVIGSESQQWLSNRSPVGIILLAVR